MLHYVCQCVRFYPSSVSGCFWVFLSVSECFWVFLGVSECFWVFLGVSECFSVFLCVSVCFWVFGMFSTDHGVCDKTCLLFQIWRSSADSCCLNSASHSEGNSSHFYRTTNRLDLKGRGGKRGTFIWMEITNITSSVFPEWGEDDWQQQMKLILD